VALIKNAHRLCVEKFYCLVLCPVHLGDWTFCPCRSLQHHWNAAAKRNRAWKSAIFFNWQENSRNIELLSVTTQTLILKLSAICCSKSHAEQGVNESTAHKANVYQNSCCHRSTQDFKLVEKFNFLDDHDLWTWDRYQIETIVGPPSRKQYVFEVHISFTYIRSVF